MAAAATAADLNAMRRVADLSCSIDGAILSLKTPATTVTAEENAAAAAAGDSDSGDKAERRIEALERMLQALLEGAVATQRELERMRTSHDALARRVRQLEAAAVAAPTATPGDVISSPPLSVTTSNIVGL